MRGYSPPVPAPKSWPCATSTTPCSRSQLRPSRRSTGKSPRTEKDFRRLLEDPSIDAVTIATPDHWHAMMTVLACQAGKDVYVEKPASHNVVEGRRMVEAARKYKPRWCRWELSGEAHPMCRRRSNTFVPEHSARSRWPVPGTIKSGSISAMASPGQYLRASITPCGRGRHRTGYTTPTACTTTGIGSGTGGPASWEITAFTVSTSLAGGLGVDAPVAVSSGGGKYVFDDDQETPDTQTVTWDFPGAVLVYEHRIWSNHGTEGELFGIAFYGEKGTLIIGDKGWRVEEGDKAQGTRSGDGQARARRELRRVCPEPRDAQR